MGPVETPSARRSVHSTANSRLCRSQHNAPRVAWPLLLLMGLLTASVVQAGPVIRARRMVREIYVDNSAASGTAPENTSAEVPGSGNGSSNGAGNNNNATANADMCLYDGSYIERAAIACEKKHGCRAIQKTGECCPDFQCECQRDGKTYANGEKVFDTNTPCRSCYCQGGEITCSEVSCYKRNDCDPKYIPGRCCPEYDNCPPLENFKITESSTTNTKDAADGGFDEHGADETNEVKGNYASAGAEAADLAGGLQKQHASSEAAVTGTTTTTTTTTTNPAPAMPNDNPLGIKIKEITKPEEIRLTDNRPSAEEQQQQQQLQQQQQQQQQQQLLAMVGSGRETTPEPSSSQSEELVNLEHLDVNVPDDDDDGENGTKIVRHTDGDGVRSGEEKVAEPGVEESPLKVASVENRLESSESSTAAGTVSSSTLSESDEWLDVKEIAESEGSNWSPSPSATFNAPSSTQAPPPAPSTSGPETQDEEGGQAESNGNGNMKLSSKQENALPAVVQIGDKLVIVDHNQPKPITVIQVEEVEGLQRGEDDTVYDQEAYTERSHHQHQLESASRESSKKLKLHHTGSDERDEQETLSTQADSSGSYETVYHPGSTEQVTGGGAVSSEEIFETQLYTEGPEDVPAEHVNGTVAPQGEPLSVSREEFLHTDSARQQEPAKLQQQDGEHTTVGASGAGEIGSSSYGSTEEGSTTMSDSSASIPFSAEASGDGMIYDTHFYTEGPTSAEAEAKEHASTRGPEETSTAASTTPYGGARNPPPVADELAAPQQATYIEDNEHELIHPGFQPIPEDFSLPQLDQPMAMEMGDEMEQPGHPQEKILAEVLELKANGTATTAQPAAATSEPSSTEGAPSSVEEASNSPAWLKEDPQPQLRTPGEPLLIPEWERKNGTNASGASSSSSSEEDQDLTASGAGGQTAAEYHVLKMGSDEYVDAGEGSGSGAAPTTSAPSSSSSSKAENRSEEDENADGGKEGAEVAEPGSAAGASAKSLLDIDSPPGASASVTNGQSESDSVKHNPKNDVESLKYDEDENETTADEAIPKKVQQLESSESRATDGGVQGPTLTSV